MSITHTPLQRQLLTIDFLKVFAAQIIILHHLSRYGILSEMITYPLNQIANWFDLYGANAVPIFLVIAGYLSSKSFQSHERLNSFGVRITNRYLRLMPSFLIVLILTIGAAKIARIFSGEEYIGNPETWTQFLAHLFLVHQIFEVESIFAGAWYVAIDWQLYIFLTLLLTVLDRFIFRVTALFVCIIFSLTYFNQHSQFDVYFFYFLVPYGLGILAFWASQESNHRHRHLALTFFTVANIAILITTLFNPNIKNALSIFVALVLLLWGNRQYQNLYLRITQVIVWLSQRSYGAFLIHFSLILLGNTLFNQVLEQTPLNALIVIISICFLSWACAHLLYIWVELPSRRLQIFSTQPLQQN